ncbi:ATP-binding protein [Rapidithrix thailandica]|uniref:histidine kinase n=1 Tax=Rapidithrix thailandica TaxID=413964 RepID=A0AAW9SF39_9BACT
MTKLSIDQKLLNGMLDSFNEGVIMLNPYGEVEYYNATIEKVLGIVPDKEFIQKYFPSSPTNVLSVTHMHFMYTHPYTETDLSIDTRVVPFNGSEQEIYYLIYLQDVSALRKEQRQIKVLEDAMKQWQTKCTRLLDDIESLRFALSHGLSAPLRHINGYAGFALEDTDGRPSEEQVKYLERIVGSSVKIKGLVRNLLDYIKISKAEVHLQPLDIRLLIKDCLNNLERYHTVKVTVEYDLEVNTLHADEELLKTALQELLDNARVAVKSVINPQIAIRAYQVHSFIYLEIQDNGVGYNPKYSDNLFKVFHKLHAIEIFPGNGIGLAMVQRIVEIMDGKVHAEALTSPIGAKFTLQLPV